MSIEEMYSEKISMINWVIQGSLKYIKTFTTYMIAWLELKPLFINHGSQFHHLPIAHVHVDHCGLEPDCLHLDEEQGGSHGQTDNGEDGLAG